MMETTNSILEKKINIYKINFNIDKQILICFFVQLIMKEPQHMVIMLYLNIGRYILINIHLNCSHFSFYKQEIMGNFLYLTLIIKDFCKGKSQKLNYQKTIF